MIKASRKLRRKARALKQRRLRKLKAWYDNEINRTNKVLSRRFEKTSELSKQEKARQDVINSMTNWQRNQMLRACKGAVRELSLKQLKAFAERPHHKAA